MTPSSFKIMSRDLDTTVEGTDYIAYVHVTIQNRGETGNGILHAKVMQGDDSWEQCQSFHLNAGESGKFTFKFEDIEFWNLQPAKYETWIGQDTR